MKHLVCSVLTLALSSTVIFGKWAMIPLRELVAKADLIVVGTLNSAEENESGIGQGYVFVEEVVFGNAKTLDGRPLRIGNRLKIKWADDWACAAGMHMGRQGKRGIWLLDVSEDGTVSAGYPGKFRDVASLSEIRRQLRIMDAGRVVVDKATDESDSVDAAFVKVDFTPWPDYSLARAIYVLLLAGGLYIVLYRSRFRFR